MIATPPHPPPSPLNRANRINRNQWAIGLTIIELLVIVAIIAILVAIIFPMAQNLIRRGQDTTCINNLRVMGIAAHTFAADNNGRLPMFISSEESSHPGEQWDVQLAEYMDIDLRLNSRSRTPFVCPAAKRYSNHSIPWSRNLSYGMNRRVGQDMHGSGRMAAIQQASEIVLIADRELRSGTNENWLTLHGARSAMFISNTNTAMAILPYERHGGHIHILFVDGHVSPRMKLGRTEGNFTENWPRGVRWWNHGPLSPSE